MAKVGIFCNGPLPTYAHTGDAGADIRSNETVTLQPGERKLVGTGLRFALQPSLVAMICSRSGLAHKHGIMVVNAPGIVDSGYRGEIKVNLINLGDEPFEVTDGMRIAQVVVTPFCHIKYLPVEEEFFNEVDRLEEHDARGANGHGSSGLE